MSDAAFLDALVYYRTIFPTLASLGDGSPPAAWLAEFQKTAPDTFDATLATSASLEGGTVQAVKNFDAVQKMRALQARRAELDVTYVDPYTVPAADRLPPRRLGFRVRGLAN